MRRRWQEFISHWLPSDWLPRAVVRFGLALVLTAATGAVLKVLAKAGTPLVVLACIGVFFVGLGLTMRGASALPPSTTPEPVPEARAPDPASLPVTKATKRLDSVSPPDASTTSGTEPNSADSLVARHVVDVTPEHLAGFFDAHTSIQANKLVAPYLGKWIKVSGPLGNISGFTTFSQVTFEYPRFGSLSVYMYFNDRDVVENRLAVLKKGDRVTILGQINRVMPLQVELENCELIDVSRPQSPEPAAPELIFDEAPPELADMTPASLKELLAGRTEAQGETHMEQHVGKPVRVSGEVERVERMLLTGGPIPVVHLKVGR